MAYALTGLGVAVIIAAVSIGFIKLDDVTYMRWRLIFAAGEGLALSVGVMLIMFGLVVFRDT